MKLFKKIIFSFLSLFLVLSLASCFGKKNEPDTIKNNEVALNSFTVKSGCTTTVDHKKGILEAGNTVSLAINLSNPKGYKINNITFKFEGTGAVTYNTKTYKFISHQTEGDSEGTTLTWNTIDNGKLFFTSKTDGTLDITVGDITDVKFDHLKVSISKIQYGSSTVIASGYVGENNSVDLYACTYSQVDVTEKMGYREFTVKEIDPNIKKDSLKVLNEAGIQLTPNEAGVYSTEGSIVYLIYTIVPVEGVEFNIEQGSKYGKFVIYEEPKA